MKLTCSNGILDLDRFNGFDPAGRGPFCQLATDGYGGVPDADRFLTDDGGNIYYFNFAMKMVLDACIRLGAPEAHYITAESARSAELDRDGDASPAEIPEGAFREFLEAQGCVPGGLRMAPVTRICRSNLKILDGHDLAGWLYQDAAGGRLLSLLGRYLYVGKDARTAAGLAAAIAEILPLLGNDGMRDFADLFYGVLDAGAADNQAGAGAQDGADQEEEAAPESQVEDGGTDETPAETESQPEPEKPAEQAAPAAPGFEIPKVHKIPPTAITGVDETYAAGYCETFYDKELENADSEGFLDQLILSRTTGTPAPIALLSETLANEPKTARNLREKLADVAEAAAEAAAEAQEEE